MAFCYSNPSTKTFIIHNIQKAPEKKPSKSKNSIEKWAKNTVDKIYSGQNTGTHKLWNAAQPY